MAGESKGTLSEADLKQVKAIFDNSLDEQKKNFWIDAEQHYVDHANLRSFKAEDIHSLQDLAEAYRAARSLFWKAFLGAAIVGSLILSAIGVGFEK